MNLRRFRTLHDSGATFAEIGRECGRDERLVTEHGFTGHYQRVKMFPAEARPRIAPELAETDENQLTGLHRRFEVIPGARPRSIEVRRAISSVTSACQRSTRSTWCCRIRGTRFAVSPPAWIWRPIGTVTGGGLPTSVVFSAQSSPSARRR
jgi:hypothetical protein